MYMIEFSAQCGSSQAGKAIAHYHVLLNRIFYQKQDSSDYFKTHEFFSIIFRVSGKHQDFKSEGAERLKKVRGENIYTIDFVIPEERWQNKTDEQLRVYIAEGVRTCYQMLKEKVMALDEVIDEDKLDQDFEYGMEQFMSSPLPELKDR